MTTGSSSRIPLAAVVCAMLIVGPIVAYGAGDERINWRRVRRLTYKQRQNQPLSDEEKTYLDRAHKAMRDGEGLWKGSTGEPKSSIGLIPLTDMMAKDKYKGQDGGLYGAGRNRPPKAHEAAARKQLAQILPLDREGKPSHDGKIVLISIGMSNTKMEFEPFMVLAAKEANLSPHLVIVNGAHGGIPLVSWINPVRIRERGNITVWEYLDQKLGEAGVSGKQVQVAWIKQAEANPARQGQFPAHAEKFSQGLGKLVRLAKQRYPNLRVAYLSSRIYAGYAITPLNPEPYAYESAFAVRWTIRRQIKGDKELNYDPQRGEVVAPLLLWGPYLWADGVKGRKGDELVYKLEDLRVDGTHPSNPIGRQKVAKMLLKFFKTDPLAETWFIRSDRPH